MSDETYWAAEPLAPSDLQFVRGMREAFDVDPHVLLVLAQAVDTVARQPGYLTPDEVDALAWTLALALSELANERRTTARDLLGGLAAPLTDPDSPVCTFCGAKAKDLIPARWMCRDTCPKPDATDAA